MARACLVLMGDELNIDNENKRRQGMDLRRSRAMVVNDIFEIDEDENNLSPLENALNRKKLTNIACKYFWVSFLIFLSNNISIEIKKQVYILKIKLIFFK